MKSFFIHVMLLLAISLNSAQDYSINTLIGHNDSVTSLLVLPDGSLVSGSFKELRIWNISKNETIKILNGHSSYVFSLVILPNNILASASIKNDKIILWDIEKKILIKTLNDRVTYTIKNINEDESYAVEEIYTNEETKNYKSFEVRPKANPLFVLSDGLLVSGDDEDEDAINIWDTIKSITIKKFEFKDVLSLDVLPNGLLASGGHELAIWNITSKKKIELKFYWSIICLVVLSDDFVAISASTSWVKIYFIIIFDISTGQINKTLTGHTSFVTHLTILSNNSLASASLDKTIRIWDIEKQLTIKILIGHNNYVNYLIVLPNGLLASASGDSTIKIWNISTIKNETNNNILYSSIKLTGHNRLTGNKVFHSLVLLNDGSLASGDWNEIIIWNITNNGKIIKKLNDSTIGLVVLPNGLLVSRYYSEIKVWNITSGLKINTLNDHPDLIKTNNGLVVIDSYLKNYFNITSTTDIFELIGHNVSQSYLKSVLSLVILPDKSLISGSYEDIIIWNITTKEKIRIIDDEYFMRYLVNLDDGSFAGSSLEKIKIWNITNGKLIRTLIGHTMEVVSLAVISNGLLASASLDTTIRVWDATKGETRMILIGHNYPIMCLKALPNGLLASGSLEIKIWNVVANIPTTTTTTTTTTPSTTIATSPSTTITINKKDFTSTQFIPINALLYIIICLLVCLIGLIFISILKFI
jgi:WD40 repeat protein